MSLEFVLDLGFSISASMFAYSLSNLHFAVIKLNDLNLLYKRGMAGQARPLTSIAVHKNDFDAGETG
jgi:hypothetical protein